jgi:hypothetical protein
MTACHPDPPALDAGFQAHATREQVIVRGTVIPGLRARLYRRRVGARTETVGLYVYGTRELFVAWGYADERHCRYHAVRRDGGGWYPTRRGCPVLHPLGEHGEVTGLRILAGRLLLSFRLADPRR